MSPRSRYGRHGALALLAATLAGGPPGCARNGADWFDVDWAGVLAEEGSRGGVGGPVPGPALAAPPALPEFTGSGSVELSVEQAVLLALRRNRGLAVAQLTPVVVGAFEQVERGAFAPEVFAEAEFDREKATETARSTGQQFNVIGDDQAFAAGVRQDLGSGTSVEVGITQDRSISNRAPEQESARIGLTVTQSLLRGFGPRVNLAMVRQAELDTRASRYELRGFTEALLAETEIAYWTYQLAQRRIDIVERSLDVARQQDDQIGQRIEVGVIPPTEAAAARSEVALREQALIDARSELEAARLRLLRLVNAPLTAARDRVIVPISDPAGGAGALGDLADRVALARRRRPDLSESRLRLDQGRLETIRTRNGLLPRLDFFIALGKTGYSDTFSGSLEELDGSTYDVAAGLSLSQSLGQTAQRGRYEAALATRQQAAAAVRNLEQLVELDVHLAANDAERARQQIDATVTTRKLQEETMRAELERFEVGASTALLVAQAQRDLLAAQIAEVDAVVNYRIALVRLYLAEGSLLERRGITIGPAS